MDAKKMNRILIVDDEAIIHDILSETFSDAGYVVQSAESAEAAVDIMNKDPAWVIFLDLNLPGMKGTELCVKIRQEWPIAIVFAITGYASLFELTNCREAGFEDFFIKPIDRKLVVEAARNAFKKLERWIKV
jgi:CheY-like chemotaxis protein